MSNTLPRGPLATPFTPRDFNAPSIALPCGSRMPDLRVTVTRAFIGGSFIAIWRHQPEPQATDGQSAPIRSRVQATANFSAKGFSAQGRLLIAPGAARAR